NRRKTEFFGHALLLLSAPTATRGVLVSRASGHHSQNLQMATSSISTLTGATVRPHIYTKNIG
ncbi:MAG TPA: hypothetical protein VHF46_03840, partial [Rubrobacteraceae bacterium]|nr:hypothetical protein [Rubrobacteraceae bacterium]